MGDVELLVEEYISWYKKEIKVKNIQCGSVITTPFLDKNNDHISVCVELNENNVILSDDGYYINNLETYGVSLTKNRIDIIKDICSQYGAELNGKEIVIKCKKKDYPNAMHRLIQTILSVDDLYNISTRQVKN